MAASNNYLQVQISDKFVSARLVQRMKRKLKDLRSDMFEKVARFQVIPVHLQNSALTCMYAMSIGRDLEALACSWLTFCAEVQKAGCCRLFCDLPRDRLIRDLQLVTPTLQNVRLLASQDDYNADPVTYNTELALFTSRISTLILLLSVSLHYHRYYEKKYPHFMRNVSCHRELKRWAPSSLTGAVFANRPDLVTQHLRNGVDVNATGVGGLTPIHMAVLCGHTHFVLMLLEAGAQTYFVDNCFECSPLDVARARGDIDILMMLQPTGNH